MNKPTYQAIVAILAITVIVLVGLLIISDKTCQVRAEMLSEKPKMDVRAALSAKPNHSTFVASIDAYITDYNDGKWTIQGRDY